MREDTYKVAGESGKVFSSGVGLCSSFVGRLDIASSLAKQQRRHMPFPLAKLLCSLPADRGLVSRAGLHIMDPPSLKHFVGKTGSPRAGSASERAHCVGTAG